MSFSEIFKPSDENLPVLYSFEYCITKVNILDPELSEPSVELRFCGLPALKHDANSEALPLSRKITFVFTPDIWKEISLVLMSKDEEIGSSIILTKECFMPLLVGESDCIIACFVLKDSNGNKSGSIVLHAAVTNEGSFVDDNKSAPAPCRRISGECSAQTPTTEGKVREVTAAGGDHDHDILRFEAHGSKGSSSRPMTVELGVPRRKVRVLPPYHEDVAVQTDAPVNVARKKKNKTGK